MDSQSSVLTCSQNVIVGLRGSPDVHSRARHRLPRLSRTIEEHPASSRHLGLHAAANGVQL